MFKILSRDVRQKLSPFSIYYLIIYLFKNLFRFILLARTGIGEAPDEARRLSGLGVGRQQVGCRHPPPALQVPSF
jgi:hypothetical protein